MFGECHGPCTLKTAFVDFERIWHFSHFKKTNLSMLSQWQSKVVDLVDPSCWPGWPRPFPRCWPGWPIPSLISIQFFLLVIFLFYFFIYMIELVLVLNITEILLAVRKAMLNQSSIGGISHFVSQVSNCTGYSPTVGSFLESLFSWTPNIAMKLLLSKHTIITWTYANNQLSMIIIIHKNHV